MNHLPQAPEKNIRTIPFFFLIHGDIRKSRTGGVVDTVGKRQQWQIMGTVSDCVHLIVKFGTALMGYSGTWRKLIHEKPEVKNLMTLSL
jgi:hypothetical protein